MIVGYDTQPWTASLSSLRLLAVAEMQKDKNFTAIEKRSEVMVAVTMADKLAVAIEKYKANMKDDEPCAQEFKAVYAKLAAAAVMAAELVHIEIRALTQAASTAEAKRNEEAAAHEHTASATAHHEGSQISLSGAQEIWASPPESDAKAV